MTPLRILHLRVVRGTGGGPDKTTLRGCAWLRRHGHDAQAFYMLDAREDTGRLQQLAAELGVPMRVALERSPLSPGTLWRLREVLAGGRFDVLHTHDYKSNAMAQLARVAFGFGGRVVATAHGYNRTTRREVLYYGLERACFRHVRAIICPTRDMWRLLRGFGLPASRLHVIPNGIETAGRARPKERRVAGVSPASGMPVTAGEIGGKSTPNAGETPATRATTRLLYLGRLSAEKDVANLLRAAVLLRERGVRFDLRIAGDGPERASLEAQAREANLLAANTAAAHAAPARVEFLGFRTDVDDLLAEADILVNPSQTECMPNSVLEAMWAGVGVVATNVGGLSEMIRHTEQGLLCPPRDSTALADAVAQLAGNRDELQRMTQNAAARVDAEFTFESRMNRVETLYRTVLDESQSPQAISHKVRNDGCNG